MKKSKTYDLSDIITLKKHNGCTVEEVCLKDPKHILKLFDLGYKFTNTVLYFIEELDEQNN